MARLKPGQGVKFTASIWRTRWNKYGPARVPAGSKGRVRNTRARPLRQTTYDVKVKKTWTRPARLVSAVPRSSLRKGKNRRLQWATIGACLLTMVVVGQIIGAKKGQPAANSPHQYWAVELRRAPPNAVAVHLVRPPARTEVHLIDGESIYPTRHTGSVRVIGDVPSRKQALAFVTRLPSAKRLGALVVCVGTEAWCQQSSTASLISAVP